MRYFREMPLLTVAMVVLGACSQKAPQGQIAAIVNGEDITDAEVRAELGASTAPIDRKVALQRVITRKLIIEDGRSNEIDKDPKLLLDERRMQENLLAERTLQSVVGKSRGASDVEAADYLAAHDDWYSNRRQLLVDEIVFPQAALAGKAKLPDVQNLNTLADFLSEQKIAFSRRHAVIDTATTDMAAAAALTGKSVGGVATLSLHGMQGYFQVLKERTVPMDKPAALTLIRTQLSNRTAQLAVAEFEKQLRKQAKIELR